MRIWQSVQDAEVANLHKRMDILRKENEALRAERARDTSADRIAQLENELRVAQQTEKSLREEIKVLNLELKRARKSLGDAPDMLSALQAREAAVEEKIRKYRELVKQYVARHDQDQRFMRQQQKQMVDMDAQLRVLKGDYAPIVLAPLPQPMIPPNDLDDSSVSGTATSSGLSTSGSIGRNNSPTAHVGRGSPRLFRPGHGAAQGASPRLNASSSDAAPSNSNSSSSDANNSNTSSNQSQAPAPSSTSADQLDLDE